MIAFHRTAIPNVNIPIGLSFSHAIPSIQSGYNGFNYLTILLLVKALN